MTHISSKANYQSALRYPNEHQRRCHEEDVNFSGNRAEILIRLLWGASRPARSAKTRGFLWDGSSLFFVVTGKIFIDLEMWDYLISWYSQKAALEVHDAEAKLIPTTPKVVVEETPDAESSGSVRSPFIIIVNITMLICLFRPSKPPQIAWVRSIHSSHLQILKVVLAVELWDGADLTKLSEV